jgi:hypothetical protein
MTPTYFTNASSSGSVRYNQLPSSIGIPNSPNKPIPIGMASERGRFSFRISFR